MKSKKMRLLQGSKLVYFSGMLLAGVGVSLFLAEILTIVQNPAVLTESETGGRSLVVVASVGVGLVLLGFTGMAASAQSVSMVGFGLEPKLGQDDKMQPSFDDRRTRSEEHTSELQSH